VIYKISLKNLNVWSSSLKTILATPVCCTCKLRRLTHSEGVYDRLDVRNHVSYALSFLDTIPVRKLRAVIDLRLCVRPHCTKPRPCELLQGPTISFLESVLLLSEFESYR
jgi:hypothetical protein